MKKLTRLQIIFVMRFVFCFGAILLLLGGLSSRVGYAQAKQATRLVAPTAESCDPLVRSGWQPYRVQPGETLADLARRADVEVETLVRANCLSNEDIRGGELLLAPPAKIAPPTSLALPTLVMTPTLTGATALTPTIPLTPTALLTTTLPAIIVPSPLPTAAITSNPATTLTVAPVLTAPTIVTPTDNITEPISNSAPLSPTLAPPIDEQNLAQPPLEEAGGEAEQVQAANPERFEQQGIVIILLMVTVMVLVYLMLRAAQGSAIHGFPTLTVAAHLLFLLGGFLLGLLAYPHFRLPSLVDLPMPVAAGSAILLLALLAIRELILPLEGRWKAVRQFLNILIIPLLTFFFLIAGARIAVLLQ